MKRRLARRLAAAGAPFLLQLAAPARAEAPAHATPPPASTAGERAAGTSAASSGVVVWQERFERAALDWIDPLGHGPAEIAGVYTLANSVREAGGDADAPATFLHARHDRSAGGKLPALHYGKAFEPHPIPLEKVRALRWRWRALRHPAVSSDPWIDLAVSVYVLIRRPSLLHSGRGFKFGWLAKPAGAAHQRGLLEVPLRTGETSREWRSESVDLCALYKQEYGDSCAGETIQYIGVVTDADNTRSIAEGDYADFSLELNR